MFFSLRSLLYILIINLLICTAFGHNPPALSISLAQFKGNTRYRDDLKYIDHSHLEDYTLITRYFDTIPKKVYLEDGRSITCKIPLIKAEKVHWEEKRNMTTEEVQSALIHFKDTCTRHRTDDFLWEFCYGKYFRQYDDSLTIQKAKKKGPELFFLGFFDPENSHKFKDNITTDTFDYTPEREYFEKETRFRLRQETYIQTFGHMVRTSNVTELSVLENYEMLALEVDVLASELTNTSITVNIKGTSLRAFLESDKLSTIMSEIDGKKYYRLQRLIKVIVSPAILFLDQPFPFDIATNKFEIKSYGNKDTVKADKFSATELYQREKGLFFMWRNYLYGPGAFLTQADPALAFIAILNETRSKDRLIVSVLDDSVLELSESVKAGPMPLKHVIMAPSSSLMLRNIRYTHVHKRIWLLGTTVIANGTSFTKEFQRGDIILIIDFQYGMNRHTYAREILRVVSDNVMIVRPFRRDGPVIAVSFPNYFIGKYNDNEKESQALAKERIRKSYKDPALNHINTKIEKSLYLTFDFDQLDDTEIHCQNNHEFMNPESWLLSFKASLITLEANLLLHFGNEECSTDGVEVNFYHMQKVIVSNHGEKSSFLAAPMKWDPNENIFAEDIFWILFHDGVLRVGKGKELSLANQLIFFESKKHKKLSRFYFNKMFSANAYLSDIQISNPSKKALETLKLMEDTPIFTGGASYFEEYTMGTYCDPIGKERKVEVEFSCAKNGEFMKIEEIKEPATCEYHLIVGSNLFCPDEYRRSHKYEELSSKISCII